MIQLDDKVSRFLESEADDTPTSDSDDINNYNFNYHYNYQSFPLQHEIGLNWTSRIAAILSLLGGLYIGYWAWKRRDHVYHRIMFGMCTHCCFSVFYRYSFNRLTNLSLSPLSLFNEFMNSNANNSGLDLHRDLESLDDIWSRSDSG